MLLQEKEALSALGSSDLLALGITADALRRSKHPENVVTYALRGPYARSIEDAARNHPEVSLSNVAGVDELSLEALVAQLKALHRAAPTITFHHLPLPCSHPGLPGIDELGRLRDAGVRSIQVDVHKLPAPLTPDLIAVLRSVRDLDIGVSTSFSITSGEPIEHRVQALSQLRFLQDDTLAIQSVLVRVQHASTPEARREEDATAVDYLKTLAVTRTFLGTIEHLQADWSVMGPKVLELALRFGADDAGTVARSQAGPEPSHHGGESELRRIIRDAGFQPVQRDALFRQSVLR